VLSIETFPRTHGRLTCAGHTVEICFFRGSLDLAIAAHNAIFVFLIITEVEEGGAIFSLSSLAADPGCDLFLVLRTLPTRFSTSSLILDV
jgi:hypothetical protein